MHKNQRANALQKARAAEIAAFQLDTYLDDIGAPCEEIKTARQLLRETTKKLSTIPEDSNE